MDVRELVGCEFAEVHDVLSCKVVKVEWEIGSWFFVDPQTMITSSASSDSWSTDIAMPARHCNPRLICTYLYVPFLSLSLF